MQNNTQEIISSRRSISDFTGALGGLVSHVDTIEELTFILLADKTGLANLSAAKGNGTIVNTFEDEFVFDVSGKADSATGLHADLLGMSTTKEVSDEDSLASFFNFSINGEMSVHQLHFVYENLKIQRNAALL